MKTKKKSSLLLLPLFLLTAVSCGNKDSEIKPTDPANTEPVTETGGQERPTEEKLAHHDDVMNYENYIRMPGGQETADPFVFRFNGKYYLFPTTNGRAVRCYVSEDMINWELADNGVNSRGFCYEYSNDGSAAPKSTTPFAPEITYFNGTFYMIMSPSGNGHYILSAPNPDGPYTCITDNVERSIDGSFFITDDERILLYGAGSGSIQAYELNDDFTSFRENDDGSEFSSPITGCHMGGWNEGPYLLNRYGEYYMTWTGTHYLNRDYRVDYCYAPEGSNLLSSNAFTRKGTVLLETKDDFYALGHSCTVLGPDMDSYYIAYHHMVPGTSRYLNISRLSFDGSNMAANYVRLNDCVGTDLPPFYTDGIDGLEETGSRYLSATASEDSFTAEFNSVGEGKMIFSYQDSENYAYLLFENNTLSVHKVLKGSDALLSSAELIHTFDSSVYHTYRIQYRNNRMVVYFDNMTKIDADGIELTGGKIGYEGEFSEIGYTAYSNVALGSSDYKSYNDEVSFAGNYDRDLSYLTGDSALEKVTSKKAYQNTDSYNMVLRNQGDMATYRMYAHENEKYDLSMRIPAEYIATTFKILVDGRDEQTITLDATTPKTATGDVLIHVADLELDLGPHNISIVNDGEAFGYSELRYEPVFSADGYDLDLGADDLSSFTGRCGGSSKVMNQTKDGLRSDNEGAYGLLTNEEYRDVTVETDVTIHSMELDGFAGLLLNVKDYSIEEKDTGNPNSYNGYQLVMANGKAAINYADFAFTQQVKAGKFSFEEGNTYHLKAVSKNNHYQLYIDDVLLVDYGANIGTTSGRVGLFSHNADVTFSSLIVS